MALQPLGGASAALAAPIEQWPFESKPYQIWTVVRKSDGNFNIKPLSSPGSCMDVTEGLQSNGASVLLYTCNGGTNQEWTFVPAR